MKLLFVIPPNYSARFSYPNLGIMYLATMLGDNSHEVRILDCQVCGNFREALIKTAAGYDAVGFYVNFFSAELVGEMAMSLRSHYRDKKIIVGGPFANYQPEKIVQDYADIVARGEGENTILDIANGRPLDSIPSIIYRTGDGGVAANEKSGEWIDVDSLPFPAWELVDYRKYGFTILKRPPMVSMMTGRGCPQNCIYCTKLIFGRTLRNRSVDNVVDEIEHNWSRYGVREIQFMDDNLTASMTRFKSICRKIIDRRLNEKLVFGVPSGIRPDTGDREMFELMKEAGFYFTVISVESADPDVSRKLRRNSDLSKVRGVIKMARDAGLIVSTFYIIGTPFDTKASMKRSMDFALDTDANIISIFFLVPFPGTDIYDYLVGEKLIEPESLNRCYSYTSMIPLFEANDWTRDDLVRIAKTSYRAFYFSRRRILMNLFTLSFAYANPLRLLKLLLGLIFHGNPAHDRKI